MSARRPMVAGNWKLHKTLAESRRFVSSLRERLDGAIRCEVVVAPVFTALSAVADEAKGSAIEVAAQDVFFERSGAFTGEVSAPLLADAGCALGIVGHSERRQLFGEADDAVHRKMQALLAEGLRPIVCVGETLDEREAGRTFEVVLGQVDRALGELPPDGLAPVILAYEPVWAIGTGRNAAPADAQAVHARIRARVAETKGRSLAESMRILYGGSVKPDNAHGLLAEPDVDGALVGGASLEVETFLSIVRAA